MPNRAARPPATPPTQRSCERVTPIRRIAAKKLSIPWPSGGGAGKVRGGCPGGGAGPGAPGPPDGGPVPDPRSALSFVMARS